MKKSLTTAGAASLVVAAMPIVGVFAADGNKTITDTIKVTIDSACSVTSDKTDNTYAVDMTNSQLNSNIGSTVMNVKCNDAHGWKVTAVGSGSGATVDVLDAAKDGADIATGTATSGAASNWAFKVAGDSTVAAYKNFAAIPTTAAKVAEGSVATDMTAGTNITTTYQVWISATQQADTYTGQVTYTLLHPNS